MIRRDRDIPMEMQDRTGRRIAKVLTLMAQGMDKTNRATIESLTQTVLASGTTIVEVAGVPPYVDDVSDYAEYGITDTGWYIFVRVYATGEAGAGEDTAITGAAGYVFEPGDDYVDLAVRFGVTAESQVVTIAWDSEHADTYVFKATDLAVRNLDYRTTFYVYDAGPFVSWSYALTTDAAFVENKAYYTKDENDVYTLAQVQTKAYALTADTTFQEGKTYYTKDGDTYTAATVTVGDPVTPETYYEQSTVPVPENTYYNHSKITIQGLTRNVTYRINDIIDCPMEFILPAIEDETYGCWFEIRCRHAGEYSMTLVPPSEDVKIATEHTQKETAGFNSIVLHYSVIDGVKLWRFMNTHSSIPT